MIPGQKLSVFVVGTRAQLIKVAPVIVVCEKNRQPVVLLLTGQHKETMADLIAEFGIETVPELAVRSTERSTIFSLLRWVPGALIGIFRSLSRHRKKAAPVNVVVHGDTLSTALGAIASKLSGCKCFHLESGLSSGKLLDPFPEELTRRIVFRLTDVALCPGNASAEYMRKNHNCEVVDTGENTIIDSVMMAARVHDEGDAKSPQGTYIVASLHRFQNLFDAERLRFLVDLIVTLAADYRIFFVLHPATRKRLESQGFMSLLMAQPNVVLSPRLGYRDFLGLAAGAACVLTDGGSNQEELAVLGVPTVIMRQSTERGDGLGQNAVMEQSITSGVFSYLMSREFESLRRPSSVGNDFGPSALVAHELA